MKALIKEITPEVIWHKLSCYKQQWHLYRLKHKIISYIERNSNCELIEILDYLKSHPLSVLPYFYTERHNPKDVAVYRDNDKEMHYVLQDGKRLYFKKGWDEKQVQTYYNGLLIEQDSLSPHCYETAGFHVSEGEVVVDAGVAEGNFALSVIEKVKKIYLFEVDEAWITALEATFAPFGNKATIVNACVSDTWMGGG
jgi:hypothetical protein